MRQQDVAMAGREGEFAVAVDQIPRHEAFVEIGGLESARRKHARIEPL